ncbi:hypothetical protein DK45_4852 [Bordetella bronchiseptica]|nr:hypothetical protein DK45_4852 [Bordetella bronchiseptica]
MLQATLQQRRAQRAAQVRAACAPVQAGIGVAAPLAADGAQVQPQAGQRRRAGRGDPVIASIGLQPALRQHGVVQAHRHRAGHVVVAGAGVAQRPGRGGLERRARHAGHHQQRFQRLRHVGVGQLVVAVLALHGQLDQALRAQAGEVRARAGGADVGQRGQFGRGPRAAVEQAAQHARACGIRNRRGDGGQAGVGVVCVHGSPISEM